MLLWNLLVPCNPLFYCNSLFYCRNIINFLIFDYLRKHYPAQHDINDLFLKDFCLENSMKKINDYLINHDIVDKAIAVKEKADDILLFEGDGNTLTEEMIFDCIKKTFMFVEYII